VSADFPSGTFPVTGHTAAPSVPVGPRVGDIVVYVGDVTGRSWAALAWQQRKESGTEFIVTRTQTEPDGVQCVEARPDDNDWYDDDWFFAARSDVHVVRRASYTEVQS
jgi:hypothetical protein